MRFSPAIRMAIAALGTAASASAQVTPTFQWPQHSMERPAPRKVTPGAFVSAAPPSDAIVLFDGTSLDAWRSADDPTRPARWLLRDGYMEVAAGTGAIATRQNFGDVQLHIEWMAPNPPKGTGQDRGNSGVFFMGSYEVQVLDSYENATYPDGQAASLYGQFPPLVNASRPAGEWQAYDIVFHRPHFDASGRVARPARLTVLHNGILVHEDMALVGPTSNGERAPYAPHADALPISLQDHSHPVRFRNIWVRKLE